MLHAGRTFSSDMSSPARVRRFVRRALMSELPADRLQTAVLLASELATNAILHARTDFDLRLCLTGRMLQVAVTDGSSRPPSPVVVDANATSGRGLRLLVLRPPRGGPETPGPGRGVWFELPLSPGVVIDRPEPRAARL